MAIQTTSNLSNSVTTVYKSKYLDGVHNRKLYDQIAVPYTELGADGKSMAELFKGTTIYVPFLSDMVPGTTAISQSADVTPQILTDATASVTTTSIGEATQFSELLSLQAYTDYTAKAYEKVGQSLMESLDILAYKAALAANWVERAAARASLDAGTVSHRASDSIFRKYDGLLQSLEVPGYVGEDGQMAWAAIMHPYVFHDIQESGNVNAIGVYQDKGISLNWELGQVGRFRLLSSPYAKVFGAAGADNASSYAGTLSADHDALDTTLTVNATATNSDSGLFLWVGTEETSTTFYPTNEPVKYYSGASGTTLTVIGRGRNGGTRFPHVSGTAVRNADSVYPVLFAGPYSLVKVFAVETGEYGMTVGPKVQGTLDQFNILGYKFYGGYAVPSQNFVLRAEFSTSYEA